MIKKKESLDLKLGQLMNEYETKNKSFWECNLKKTSVYFLSNWLMWGLRFTYVAWNDEENDKDITQCAASCHPVTAH